MYSKSKNTSLSSLHEKLSNPSDNSPHSSSEVRLECIKDEMNMFFKKYVRQSIRKSKILRILNE
jgi:hypothetical protein